MDVQIEDDYNPHDVAALLKEFIRDLPEALLTRTLYAAFINITSTFVFQAGIYLFLIEHMSFVSVITSISFKNQNTLGKFKKRHIIDYMGYTRVTANRWSNHLFC